MTTLSDILQLIDLATGESSYDVYANWGAVTDENFDRIEDALGETVSKTVTTADVTLSDDETRCLLVKASGLLTGNRSIIAPTRKGFWIVKNDCTGSFTLTFKHATGTGVVVTAGTAATLVSDGTNIYSSTPVLPGEITPAAILASLLTVDGTGSLLDADTVDGVHASALTAFPSGTVMLFVQTAAPTGWTKGATHDNKALRVVTGSVSTGGSVAFTTAFASQSVAGTVGSYTLLTADLPSHSHTVSITTGTESADHTHAYSGTTAGRNAAHTHSFATNYVSSAASQIGGVQSIWSTNTNSANAFYFFTATGTESSDHAHTFSGSTGGRSAAHTHLASGSTAPAGSGTGHSHSFTGTAINLAVQYVDVIIATKN